MFLECSGVDGISSAAEQWGFEGGLSFTDALLGDNELSSSIAVSPAVAAAICRPDSHPEGAVSFPEGMDSHLEEDGGRYTATLHAASHFTEALLSDGDGHADSCPEGMDSRPEGEDSRPAEVVGGEEEEGGGAESQTGWDARERVEGGEWGGVKGRRSVRMRMPRV
jgi:hypothetical protein